MRSILIRLTTVRKTSKSDDFMKIYARRTQTDVHRSLLSLSVLGKLALIPIRIRETNPRWWFMIKQRFVISHVKRCLKDSERRRSRITECYVKDPRWSLYIILYDQAPEIGHQWTRRKKNWQKGLRTAYLRDFDHRHRFEVNSFEVFSVSFSEVGSC